MVPETTLPGDNVLAAGREFRVWDTETGEVVSGPFERHDGDVLSIACVLFSLLLLSNFYLCLYF